MHNNLLGISRGYAAQDNYSHSKSKGKSDISAGKLRKTPSNISFPQALVTVLRQLVSLLCLISIDGRGFPYYFIAGIQLRPKQKQGPPKKTAALTTALQKQVAWKESNVQAHLLQTM